MNGYILCIKCNGIMIGIRDIAGRHTCYECGGQSLIAAAREKERQELIQASKESRYG